MMLVLGIALAGALGTLARFAIGDWMVLRTANTFPWGTLFINVAGSFVLAFALRYGEAGALSRESRAVIGIGFCGAFTTFSTFSYETARLIERDEWSRAIGYSLVSVLAALAATFAGFYIAGLWLRRA